MLFNVLCQIDTFYQPDVQKNNHLLKNNIPQKQILYLNFEDERLLGFKVDHFQEILDVYYGRFPENKDKTCYFFSYRNVPIQFSVIFKIPWPFC